MCRGLQHVHEQQRFECRSSENSAPQQGELSPDPAEDEPEAAADEGESGDSEEEEAQGPSSPIRGVRSPTYCTLKGLFAPQSTPSHLAAVQAMDKVLDNVEEEDDMSPLLSALDKAQARLDRLTKARETEELEALTVAELAIEKRDTLESASKAIADTAHIMQKREEQLRKMEAQKLAIQEDAAQHLEKDALASVDSPPEDKADSVGAGPASCLCART